MCCKQELKELESQVQNKTVIIRNSCKRSLDMDEVVDNVKTQYADMAARSREEAEQWNQNKVRRRRKFLIDFSLVSELHVRWKLLEKSMRLNRNVHILLPLRWMGWSRTQDSESRMCVM